jgi:thiamine-monophosphate kinase
VLTHDMMVEGVHWLPGQDPADIAWKLVAVNLSDLSAKGAEPVGVLLGYMLGGDDARFVRGLAEVLDAYRVPLLGGDTVAGAGTGRAHGLTAIGRATHTPVPSRAGARPGDDVWLTGSLGGAMLGLEALRSGTPDAASVQAYARPRPLLAEGRVLAPVVTAMMDVSDGLLLDASRLAEASSVTLALERAAIPLHPDVRAADRADEALCWGDDYQLLFTLPGATAPPVAATRIGTVQTRGEAAVLLDRVPMGSDRPLGYLHGGAP